MVFVGLCFSSILSFFFFFFLFKIGSHVLQASSELLVRLRITLPPPLQCWGQWHVLSYPVYAVLQIIPRASVNIRQALCLLSSLSSPRTAI